MNLPALGLCAAGTLAPSVVFADMVCEWTTWCEGGTGCETTEYDNSFSDLGDMFLLSPRSYEGQEMGFALASESEGGVSYVSNGFNGEAALLTIGPEGDTTLVTTAMWDGSLASTSIYAGTCRGTP